MHRVWIDQGLTGGLFLALSLLLPGCLVGPDYETPDTTVPDSWHVAVVEGIERSEEPVGAWWERFDDPTLSELISLAERRNYDLRIATSSITQARSQYGIAASDLFPQLAIDPAASFTDGYAQPSVGLAEYNNQDATNAYQFTMDLAWEVDVWGKIRRSMESSMATLEAEIEAWRDLLITIRAEVALSYIEVRSYQMQIGAVERSIEAARRILDLVAQGYQRGEFSRIQYATAQADLAAVESTLPPLEEALATSLNRLSVLVGEYPGPLRERLAAAEAVPVPPATITVGVPADVIRQRPDVREAERQLAAASALIGVAEAALYPALQINGAGGFSNQQVSNLFDGSQLGGILGVSFNWPIFTAGRLESIVDLRTEQTAAALANYESTLLTAVEDVENAMISYLESRLERASMMEVLRAYEEVLMLGVERYATGIDDLETLLDTEQQLFSALQSLAVVDGQVSSNAVLLYKALGGGWRLVPEGTTGAEVLREQDEFTNEETSS